VGKGLLPTGLRWYPGATGRDCGACFPRKLAQRNYLHEKRVHQCFWCRKVWSLRSVMVIERPIVWLIGPSELRPSSEARLRP
jgi:hypothetical protein